jgi:DNA replication and repair protein RecF
MTLYRLEIGHLRNLQSVSLFPHPHLNVLSGPNGSGKTSLLEGIHLLGTGRSFRVNRVRRLVTDGQETCTVFAAFEDGSKAGIRCTPAGISELRVDGSPAAGLADLARALPLLLFEPAIFEIFDEGSKPRRAQLDWGVFHVEHSFYSVWRNYQRALKQRNSLLRSGSICGLEAQSWHVQMSEAATLLHDLRSAFMARWEPSWQRHLREFLPGVDLSLDYIPGWDTGMALGNLLNEQWGRDIEKGFTQYGPHRADLRIRAGNVPASEVLSRGQRKLSLFALKLSQLSVLEGLGQRCILMIDDLASELDSEARSRLIGYLAKSPSQVFVTAIDADAVVAPLQEAKQEFKLFHVEHGNIQEG